MSDPRSAAVIAAVEALGPRWILHLPSSTLKTVVGHFLAKDGQDGFRIVPIPREEEGVGILSGLALTGTPALMIIQDNGIGNMLTALNTFPVPYWVRQQIVDDQGWWWETGAAEGGGDGTTAAGRVTGGDGGGAGGVGARAADNQRAA